MSKLKYCLYLLASKFGGNQWMIKYYRSIGMDIGEKTHIFSKINTSEPYLIRIGENTTIATNVSLITHDASIGALVEREKWSDLCGRICIGNHCFVGDKAIIMYGVTIADSVIVAAGSVVTKSINEPGVIVAGAPARVIGTTKSFVDKYQDKFFSLHGLDFNQRKSAILDHEIKLIKK